MVKPVAGVTREIGSPKRRIKSIPGIVDPNLAQQLHCRLFEILDNAIIVRMGGAAQAIPYRKDVPIVVIVLAVMQIVENSTYERRGFTGKARCKQFESGMSNHAADLIENPQGNQRKGRHRKNKP